MMIDSRTIADQLAQFIRERFQISDTDSHFTPEVRLWEMGYVDSVGVAEVIAFLEDHYQVQIPVDALFEEERATVNGLAQLVAELVARANPS